MEGWIRCDNDLPKEKGDYLVSCSDNIVRIWWFVVSDVYTGWKFGLDDIKIIAWQPKPEPYKQGKLTKNIREEIISRIVFNHMESMDDLINDTDENLINLCKYYHEDISDIIKE